MKIDKNIIIPVASGALGGLAVVLVLIFLATNFRSQIYKYLASDYVASVKDESVENISTENILSQESFVISAVKKSTPAVASIIVTKELPVYENYFESSPFGGFLNLPDLFFNIPKQRQNGTEKKEVGGGTGFFVTEDGLIVTNRHVVEDEKAEYTVLLSDGKKYDAKVLARDEVLDIAIIKVAGSNFEYLDLGDSETISVGQSVIAIGNALAEFQNSVSVGVISGLSRSLVAGDSMGNSELLEHVIQTDAAINPGNSGGPLLDLRGNVIGVNVAVVKGSENIGFALPINSVKSIINSVKETGKIVRPYVGIRYVQIDEQMKKENDLSVDYGILVIRGEGKNEIAVIPGSPADKAGILENDIVLELDGKKLDKNQSFSLLIREKKVGDSVNLKVLSKGLEKNIKLKLENMPS
ncbi:MAG: trypsin-like peptidase domain-containing protein [Candidatus Pacebacteria bacterium]|jgi:serine protease Do|nr:trypsin-like peptidase domain-containing protein [Candidatus Paceibacterota bacterium]